jgi:hypothetical protein
MRKYREALTMYECTCGQAISFDEFEKLMVDSEATCTASDAETSEVTTSATAAITTTMLLDNAATASSE